MLLMPEIGRYKRLEMNSNKNLDIISSSMAISRPRPAHGRGAGVRRASIMVTLSHLIWHY